MGIQFHCAFNSRVTLLNFQSQQALVMLQHVDVTPWLFCNQGLHEGRNFAAIDLPVSEAGAQHPPGKLTDLFVKFHQAT